MLCCDYIFCPRLADRHRGAARRRILSSADCPAAKAVDFGFELTAPNSVHQRLAAVKYFLHPKVGPLAATHRDQIKFMLGL